MSLIHTQDSPRLAATHYTALGKTVYIEYREQTPEPSNTPSYILLGPPATRRNPTLVVSHKAPDYVERVTRKMQGKWAEVPLETLDRLVPGSNPTNAQMKKLLKTFEFEWAGMKEKEMYPMLVSHMMHSPADVSRRHSLTFDLITVHCLQHRTVLRQGQ